MKQLILVLLILIATNVCFGQNKNLNAKYSVKLYNETSWQEEKSNGNNGLFPTASTNKQFQFLHPTAAFRFKDKRNNMTEMELTQFEIGKDENTTYINLPDGRSLPLSGGKTNSTNIAVRYEYIRNFCKKSNSKWMPALGFAAMPYYERTKFNPILSNEYPAANSKVGMKAFLVPRINFAVSSRFYIDLNVPVCLADMNIQKANIKNPTLAENQQKQQTTNFNLIPDTYSFRIGLGLNI